MVASPDLTLNITAPGGSPVAYKDYLAYSGHAQQMTITQNFGRQGDTAVFPLVDEYASAPNVLIPVMSQVTLYDVNCGQVLFAGVVTDPALQVTGPNRNEWTLSCTDYTFFADNAIVHGVYDGWTVDAIVIDLTRKADCGIFASSVRDGGFVAPGPHLATFVLNYCSLSDAWRKLAALAGGATSYGWYVGSGRDLHFYDASTAIDSGVTFTTTPTVGGSTTEGHILLDTQNSYEWDGTSIHNRVLVQGATQTVPASTRGAATDTWRADGTQQSWPLRYTLSGTPALKVNGTTVKVTSVTPGTAVPSGWTAQQNAIGQFFLTNPDAPPAGTLLQAWYSYQVPVVAQASDNASITEYTGANHGVFAVFISDSSLTTTPMALARAQQERTEYAFAAERATFDSSEDFLGWVRAGETFRLVNRFIPDSQRAWAIGVNDTFLAVANQVTFTTGGYRQQQVTAIRL